MACDARVIRTFIVAIETSSVKDHRMLCFHIIRSYRKRRKPKMLELHIHKLTITIPEIAMYKAWP